MAKPGRSVAPTMLPSEDGLILRFDSSFKPNPKHEVLRDLIFGAQPLPVDVGGEEVSIPPTLVVGYGGAVGGAKTTAIAWLAFLLAAYLPGNRIVVGQDMLKNLEVNAMPKFFALCPPIFFGDIPEETAKAHPELMKILGKWEPTENIVYFRHPNWPKHITSQILFRPLGNESEILGQDLGAVLIDEANGVPESVANQGFLRLRHQLPKGAADALRATMMPSLPSTATDRNIMRYVHLCASNPWPNTWFERWFIKGTFPLEELEAVNTKVIFLKSLIEDNPHNPYGYRQRSMLLIKNEVQRKRFLDGDYQAIEGQVFNNFYPPLHRYMHAKLPFFTRFVGGLDFGGIREDAHPCAALVLGITPTCRAVILATFKLSGPDAVAEQIDWMNRMQQRYGRIHWVGDGTQSGALQMLVRDGFWVSHNSRKKDGWRNNVATLMHLFEPDGAGIPGIFYLPELKDIESELLSYQFDTRERPDGTKRERAKKVNDDLLDCLLYAMEDQSFKAIQLDIQKRFGDVLPNIA